jgi:zinc transport system ATP-binding protein
MALALIQDAAFSYEGRLAVFGLNFEVEEGDFLAIVGENGSGKSTLARGLVGLKAPVRGKITWLEGLKASEVGYLPQKTAAQADFPASVMEVALSGRLGAKGMAPFYSKADKAAARGALEKMGVAGLAGKCFRELSGGQQQRVLIARAIAAKARVLILDEPTAGLDAQSSNSLREAVSGIRQDGAAIVLITHDAREAKASANRILSLSAGSQAYFGDSQGYQWEEGGAQGGPSANELGVGPSTH